MEVKIKQALEENAETIFGRGIDDKLIQFQKTRKEVKGDLTLVTFPFAKLMNTSPEGAASKLGDFLVNELEELAEYNVIKGFLNLVFKDEYWVTVLEEMNAVDKYGFSAPNSKPTIMVEYSSPNTNKPLHLGHLRNNFLGYSVAEILKANGHKVVKTQIINDRGIHICKSMLAWQRFAPLGENGNRETPASTGLKGDHFVGKYYIEFDNQMTKEAFSIAQDHADNNFEGLDEEKKEELQKLFGALHSINRSTEEKKYQSVYRKIAGLTKDDTTLLYDAQQMLVKWEARDPETYLLWSIMNGWVYSGFESTYARMGVDFDQLYYESDTFLIGKDVVIEGLNKGVFYKKEDGSVWIDLTDDGLDEKLLLRSDGTAVYMTQDIGTAIDRFKDYPDLDGIVYTVGNEQDYHFQVLFLVLKKLGYDWAEHCYHLSYGMVDLPDGKMKSREGKVVDADDLMAEVVDMAEDGTRERGHLDGLDESQKQELYEMIGMGGLKYFLLKVDPQKRMKFNPDESIELNGNTGPFIQYAHARIKSLLNKYGAEILANNMTLLPIEKELVKTMAEFPNILKEAGSNYSPALLANYTYELVKQFNTFYQSVSILNEEVEELKQTRLVIASNIARIISNSMRLLGISVPDRM
ncbi:MAG: arginine--tRNA ligase [Crocinitomicaceae bacterium]|nr:arginine--tRNA ligase [Crocinitomicaceae bacterium]